MMKLTVLIVDDEEGARFGLRRYLKLEGCEVIEAVDCRTARESFRNASPDVAIVDFRLPDGSALELLDEFRALNPAVPVIVLTGYGSIDRAVEAVKRGAEHFLTKPVELAALRLIIERAAERRR